MLLQACMMSASCIMSHATHLQSTCARSIRRHAQGVSPVPPTCLHLQVRRMCRRVTPAPSPLRCRCGTAPARRITEAPRLSCHTYPRPFYPNPGGDQLVMCMQRLRRVSGPRRTKRREVTGTPRVCTRPPPAILISTLCNCVLALRHVGYAGARRPRYWPLPVDALEKKVSSAFTTTISVVLSQSIRL